MEPQTRFCTTPDGVRIAYATVGDGPPLVVANGWLVTMEMGKLYEFAAFAEAHARERLLILYDRRGLGASQRDVEDLSLEAHIADLSAVVEHLHLERFDLLGLADGAAISMAYAAENPARVSRLVLVSAYSCGGGYRRVRGDARLRRPNPQQLGSGAEGTG